MPADRAALLPFQHDVRRQFGPIVTDYMAAVEAEELCSCERVGYEEKF